MGQPWMHIDLDTFAELSLTNIEKLFFLPVLFGKWYKIRDEWGTAIGQQSWIYLCTNRFLRVVEICGPLDSERMCRFSFVTVLTNDSLMRLLTCNSNHPYSMYSAPWCTVSWWAGLEKETAAGRRAGVIPTAGIKMNKREGKFVWLMRYNSLCTFIEEGGQEKSA